MTSSAFTLGFLLIFSGSDTLAFGGRPNQLVTLIVRKILGSSTFAVAQTLTAIIDRLGRIELPDIADVADVETADEEAEEWEDGGDDATGTGTASDRSDEAQGRDRGAERLSRPRLAHSGQCKGREPGCEVLPEMLEEIVRPWRAMQGGDLHRIRPHPDLPCRPAGRPRLRRRDRAAQRVEQRCGKPGHLYATGSHGIRERTPFPGQPPPT